MFSQRTRRAEFPRAAARAAAAVLGEWQDQAILWGAAAVALALPPVMWGVTRLSFSSALVGALLTSVGVAVSSRLSRYRLSIALPIGLTLGATAFLLWWGVAGQPVGAEDREMQVLGADAAIAMARRMSALVVALSFWAVRPTVIGFALVPGLTVFGLASGRVEGAIVAALFSAYLAASMMILAWGMLVPEEGPIPPRRSLAALGREDSRAPFWGRSWRARHALTVGTVFLACLVLGHGFSLPMILLSDLYRWPLIMAMTPEGAERLSFALSPSEELRRFPIGRGPEPVSDTPLLAVSGQPARYWRGSVFDQYTGSAWLRWQSGLPVPSPDGIADLSDHFPPTSGAPLLTHRVRLEASLPYVVHSPGQIQRATIPLPRHLTRPVQSDAFGCLELPGAFLAKGDIYEVVSAPFPLEGSEPALVRRAGAVSPAAGPEGRRGGSDSLATHGSESGQDSESSQYSSLRPLEEMSKVYQTVPVSAGRVAELAQKVAGEAPTPEEKLELLVRYLQQNCVYSLDAPAVPRGEDAADYFLFRMKRGRCDLFASALAIMARGVGIPTRLATGFLEGKYEEGGEAYLLRDSDRHAWVEAYVPSSGGWITVDPTPGTATAIQQPHGWHLTWLRVRFFWQDHPWGTVGMVAGAILALIALAVLALRLRRRALRRPSAVGEDARGAVVRAYWQFLWLLRRRGLPRRASQTPLEYLVTLGCAPERSEGPSPRPPRGRRATSHLPELALAPAVTLTDIFVAARYGPGPVGEDRAAAARAALGEVRAALRNRGGQGS